MLALGACSNEPLGSTIEVREVAGSEITITARDTAGNVIGEASVRMGDVYLTDRNQHAYGRELSIKVGDRTVSHQDAGSPLIRLPYPDAELERFLSDARVAQPLARWNVTFKSTVLPAAGGETAYDDCTSGGPTPSSCCQWGAGNDNHYEYRCGRDIYSFTYRQCGGGTAGCYSKAYETPNAQGQPGCYTHADLKPCPAGTWDAEPPWTTMWGCYNDTGMVGPQGCAVVWNSGGPGSAGICYTWDTGEGCDYYYESCAQYGEYCNEFLPCCSGTCTAGGGGGVCI